MYGLDKKKCAKYLREKLNNLKYKEGNEDNDSKNEI